MSGMAGILRLDSALVDPAPLRKMAQALQYRGKDGTKVWHDGPVGFVHVHFWTTPEEVGEEQPICAEDSCLWITADARIDNRKELIPLLQRYLNKEVPSDVEIILAAYRHWGEDCAQHLIGDFSFAIWDAMARKLFLVRDVIGIRQLYYAVMDGAFYFANTIGAIVAALPRQPALNRPLIHEFLRGSYRRWICQTVYTEVLRLPPAHHLVVEKQVSKPQLYYVLGSGSVPQYTSDEEWLQTFRELFQEAVRCRLRSITPIGISVSGGLDSSAVACMAHEIAQQVGLPEIRLYSSIYRETPGADESEFLDAVASCCTGFTCTRVISDHCWALREFGRDGSFPLDEPEIYALRSQLLTHFRALTADGCRVALRGEGGDQLLAQNLYSEPSGLHGLVWRDWLVESRYFRLATQLNWLLLLLRAYIVPIIPGRLLAPMQSLYINFAKMRPWLRSLYVDFGRASGPFQDGFYGLPNMTGAARVIMGNLRNARQIAGHGVLDLVSACTGIEVRFPFWDRRLVDFLLHVPQHLIAWRGADRVILRESLRGALPQMVLVRRSKGDLEELVHRGLTRERQRIEELLAHPVLEKLGLVNAAILRHAFEVYWRGQTREYLELLRPIYMESWLRARM